ncbi:nucleotide-binding alpha-beta plait domain-containing protein [Artemisia annua]|uniref:Nucleotide-binding alpha-beta plait domain-containing protein n=1 Tax=Artemisia annua TaxID=35608 RepID=A0A2U1MV30_ARTAN|nr:nucleotide-binding alpha-beta plait domain-containing protein [Artemisia annua]
MIHHERKDYRAPKRAALNDHSIVATLTKTAEVDPAHSSTGPSGLNNSQTTSSTDIIRRKIVANVRSHVNPIALRSHFARFGEIEDRVLGIDNATGNYSADKLLMVNVEAKIAKSLPSTTSNIDNDQNPISTAEIESVGLSGSYGMNTLSPSMMANYGLVAYQNPRGTSSATRTGS